MSATLHVFPTAKAMAEAAAFDIVCAAIESVEQRGSFRLALTGGSSARLLYPQWRDVQMPPETHIFWSDERAVARDDDERNSRVARTLWLDHAGLPEDHLHELPAQELWEASTDPQGVAEAFERTLGDAPLDLVHLGLGPDGHVASLFPGHALLAERVRRVAAITDSPKPPSRRLTLTLRALGEAREIVFSIAGAEKAALLKEILSAPQDRPDPAAPPSATSPVPYLVAHARVVFFLDEAAASALSPELRGALAGTQEQRSASNGGHTP